MTANQDKQSNDEKARSGDIQARQADDGSFELVVEDAPASAGADSTTGRSNIRPGADASQSSSKSFKRLAMAAVAILALALAVVYALSSGDNPQGSASDSSAASFRPYQGGPNNAAAGAAPAPTPEEDDEPDAAEALAGEDDEFDEEIAAEDDEFDEEDWEPEGDSEVVVIEEEHPADDYEDETAQNSSDDEKAGELRAKPEIDTSQFQKLHQRVNIPVRTPKLERIPTPNLQKIDRTPRGDEAYREEGDEEYGPDDGRLDDYDEGY